MKIESSRAKVDCYPTYTSQLANSDNWQEHLRIHADFLIKLQPYHQMKPTEIVHSLFENKNKTITFSIYQ